MDLLYLILKQVPQIFQEQETISLVMVRILSITA